MRDLIVTITRTPDFSGLKFYVQGGGYFDLDVFCEHNNLDSAEIDNDDIRAINRLIQVLPATHCLSTEIKEI